MTGLTTRVGVAIMAMLLALYLGFSLWYSTVLMSVGTPIALGMAIGLIVLALLGCVFLIVEILFAFRAERLARKLEEQGGLPEEEFPVLPSGRIDRAAADAAFPAYRAAAEANPDDWAAWFRLALAYDAAGDRRRARWAVRRAIGLERAAGASD